MDYVPDQVCKVHAEFNCIKTLMYHQSIQRMPQLIIVLDDLKSEYIPSPLQGRFHCLYPKILDDDDEACKNLIGLLLKIEPYTLASTII